MGGAALGKLFGLSCYHKIAESMQHEECNCLNAQGWEEEQGAMKQMVL